jgi:hypothetical protein
VKIAWQVIKVVLFIVATLILVYINRAGTAFCRNGIFYEVGVSLIVFSVIGSLVLLFVLWIDYRTTIVTIANDVRLYATLWIEDLKEATRVDSDI